MSVKYHVFLPPTPLELITNTHVLLKWIDCSRPPNQEGDTQSLASRIWSSRYDTTSHDTLHRKKLSLGSLSGVQDHGENDVSQVPDTSVEVNKRRKLDPELKKAVRASRSRLSTGPPESNRDSLERRRSSRLSRTSDHGLSVLPALNITESFLSLNTTASITQASQFALPNWSIPLSKLSTLQNLLLPSSKASSSTTQVKPTSKFDLENNGNQRVCLIVCVMNVESAVKRQKKEEKAKGKEGSLWIGNWQVTEPTLSDIKGKMRDVSCLVKMWDQMARDWDSSVIRKGDIVLLENVEFKPTKNKEPASISISSTSHGISPKITILYRTLPRQIPSKKNYISRPQTRHSLSIPTEAYLHTARKEFLQEDMILRPDLRLERSDAGLRKVADYARWFAEFVGGEPP